jgi:putative FmdB family regulatory protein
MPIYEYTCKSCKKSFEKLVRSMNSEDRVSCPECGSEQTARALSLFAVGAEGAKSSAGERPACGRCGDPQGSCEMD